MTQNNKYNLDIQQYITPPPKSDECMNGLTHTVLINQIIAAANYQSYLEIGVADGVSFNNINCPNKVGVDPAPDSKATVHMTSDDYFTDISPEEKFDMIFVDGLHEWHQCYRDIVNSIYHLNPNGTIVCHDMNPIRETMLINYADPYSNWTGDVFKSFIQIRHYRSDIESAMIFDVETGIGIIRLKDIKNPPINPRVDLNVLDYQTWKANKQYLMGCMPYDVFKKNFLDCGYFDHSFAEFT